MVFITHKINYKNMKHILFVEDEATLQRSLTEVLKKEYRVSNALDGEAGLTLALKEKPDLILLDLILPKRDGFSVLEELKKNGATKSIPVIILTNLENNLEIEKALNLGATTYLIKSQYSLGDIKNKVEKVLENAY